jgi:transposase-like protein
VKNNQLKRKRYFDPYIFKKVLEDLYLPTIAKEILDPKSVTGIFKQYNDNDSFKNWLSNMVFNVTYNTHGEIYTRNPEIDG